jgi:hypothetical protein
MQLWYVCCCVPYSIYLLVPIGLTMVCCKPLLFVCCALQDLSAHVMYRLTRARLTANLLAFSVDDASNSKYKRELKEELGLLREEYRCWHV